MTEAEELVNSLLEQGSDAEIEYDSVEVDSMPHTSWLLRIVGASPTQYVAKDVEHTPELARHRARTKAELLGLNVVKEIDRDRQS